MTAYSTDVGFGMRLEASRISKLTCCRRVVVQDDAGLILIAFRDRRIAQQDAEDVYFGVVHYLHSALQYFSILLVRYGDNSKQLFIFVHDDSQQIHFPIFEP